MGIIPLRAKRNKMGFGTLFIGYFFLLNLVKPDLTDVIAAAVMLLGLYKLSFVNKFFKAAMTSAAVFLAFALGELGISAYEMFFREIGSQALVSVMSSVRYVIVGTLTILVLKGCETVAREVDIKDLAEKSLRMITFTVITYVLWIFLSLPIPNNSFLPILAGIALIARLLLIFINLTVLYACYMKICMPGEEIPKDKPSRFKFVNEYRERRAERDREVAEKRAELLRERAAKKKGRKK